MTPNLEALRDLLVKARAAKEGSGELDEVVRITFGAATEIVEFCGLSVEAPPTYTTRPLDLTAVVGLMKEGWSIGNAEWRDKVTFWLREELVSVCGTAPTPALALLIAVIEAWIYELENEND